MPKGKKTCSNCGQESGPRTYMCPNCNSSFAFKPKSKEQKNTKIIRNFNWRELAPGDRIKVTGGPYFVSGSNFVPMGYRGKFNVIKLDNQGIVAYSSKGGFCHIYMGKDFQCPETRIWKTKHRLIKLKNRINSEKSIV